MTRFTSTVTWHQVTRDFHKGDNNNKLIELHVIWPSGSTAIAHDSESSMDVGHCADPGCYSRTINYNATSRQMSALAELSAECHQSIKVQWIILEEKVNTNNFTNFDLIELVRLQFCAIGIQ